MSLPLGGFFVQDMPTVVPLAEALLVKKVLGVFWFALGISSWRLGDVSFLSPTSRPPFRGVALFFV